MNVFRFFCDFCNFGYQKTSCFDVFSRLLFGKSAFTRYVQEMQINGRYNVEVGVSKRGEVLQSEAAKTFGRSI